MKKNWLSVLLYFIGILLIIFFIIIYQQPFLLFLLFALLILPLLTLPAFFFMYPKIKPNLYCETESIEMGNPAQVRLEISNPSLFPLLSCDLHFSMQNLYFPNQKEHIISVAAKSRRTASFLVPIDTKYPGMLELKISKMVLSDFLNFCSKEVPLTIKLQVPILPKITTVPTLPPTPNADGLEEYTESDAKGMISSDVKDIREYRPGDRLQRIHWKLSAKLDELFVKEMAHTSILSLVLLPELTKVNICDTVATLYALSNLLFAREERFEICLFQQHSCEFSFRIISDENELLTAMIHLYFLPLYEDRDSALNAYYASSQKSGTIIHVIGSEIMIKESES